MKPLLKVEYINLPLSIPAYWRDFFELHAATLGISRNAALCLALKLGGPLLQTHITSMKQALRAECERLGRAGRPRKCLPGLPLAVIGNDRKHHEHRKHPSRAD